MVHCSFNLKQICLAQRLWSNDHNDTFPMRTPASQGGTREAVEKGETFRHFMAVSNELSRVKTLVCLRDARSPATDFASLTQTNVSYFIALEADEAKPLMLLVGDRNVTNGVAPQKNVLTLNTTQPAGWTEKLHRKAGNIGFTDGSVIPSTTRELRARLEKADGVDIRTQRIQLPE